MSALSLLSVVPVLVKLLGLAPLLAAYSLTIPPPKLLSNHRLAAGLTYLDDTGGLSVPSLSCDLDHTTPGSS